MERVATKLVEEGGETSLERVSILVAAHGADIIRALDNAPTATPVLKAFDDLPADQVSKAAARLAAGPQGRELAATTVRFGSQALKSELAHPGVGGHFVRTLGTDGAALCQSLSKDQAIALGRYVDDIAQAPPSQRRQLLNVINKDKERFFAWLGRFVEANPGKTIGSVTFLAIFLPNAERILGGDDIAFGADGEPQVVTKPGIVGRPFEGVGEGVSLLSRGLAIIVLAAAAVFAAIMLVRVWQHEKQRQRQKTKFNSEAAP